MGGKCHCQISTRFSFPYLNSSIFRRKIALNTVMEKLCHTSSVHTTTSTSTLLKTSHRTWAGTVVFRDLLLSRTRGGTWGTSCIAVEPGEVRVHRPPEEQQVEVGTEKASRSFGFGWKFLSWTHQGCAWCLVPGRTQAVPKRTHLQSQAAAHRDAPLATSCNKLRVFQI